MWYKGLGDDGKQAGERGMPDFTWTSNCFATSAYNSLYWFFLHGYPNMVPSGTSFAEDINNLWTNYMQQQSCGANHQSMFSGMLKWTTEHESNHSWYGTYRGLQDSGNTIDTSWLHGAQFGYPTWDFYYCSRN
jgi:hypothetical protein